MDGCRALVLKRSIDYEDIDSFRKCRVLHQKIGFVLDKWQESVGELCPRVSRQELMCAEQCLDETEKTLWKLVAQQMAAGALAGGAVQSAAPVSRGPEPRQQTMNAQLECVQREVVATRHSPSVNNPVVRVQRHVQVQNMAVQHVDPAPEKMLPAAKQQLVVNLLIDWFLTLGENGVHLEGMLLNEGHWKTSPIAERVGPLTVKTASGTTYNMSGEMCIPQGESTPDFVYNKFRYGFPNDWKEVVQDWFSYFSNEKRLAIKPNAVALQKENIPNPMKSLAKGLESRVHERVTRDDQDKMPPPSNTPRLQRKAHSQENIMMPRQHSVMERNQNTDMADTKRRRPSPLSPRQRRSSNRVLMRSLNDVSMNSTAMNNTLDMSVDLNGLKKWSAECIEETGELVLLGQLVSDNHHVIDRNFISSSIQRRLQADVIETTDGEIYRLIGPAHSTDKKLFIHGFPLQWKNYLKRGAFPTRSMTTNPKASRRQEAFPDKAANPSQNVMKNVRSPQNSNARSTASEKNSPMSSSVQQQRRTSQMIQQLVRHNIKQSQNSTLGNSSNRSVMSKKSDSSMNKRKNRSLLPLQHTGALKKMKMDDIKNHGGAARSQQNGSEADVSSQSEVNAKQSRMRDPSAGKDKKPQGEKSDMQSARQGKASTVKKSTLSSQLNTTGKYLSGMTSDVGSGEFDFNIF